MHRLEALTSARRSGLPTGIVSGRVITWFQPQNRGKQLGRGTYGEVYEYNTNGMYTSENVAVKIVENDYEHARGINSDLLTEIASMSTLRHPNVMKILDAFIYTNHMCLVLPLANDGSLRDKLDADTITLREKKLICAQLLRGVAYLHSKDVLHGDLKPENVLITTRSPNTSNKNTCTQYIISDFGLASMARCVEKSNYGANLLVFTIHYRPPELLLGGNYTVEGDSWALGCILYEVMTGSKLAEGGSEIDQILRLIFQFGTPTEETWPGVSKLKEYYPTFPQYPVKPRPVLKDNTNTPTGGDEVVWNLLVMNPKQRITPVQALNNSFFDDVRDMLSTGCLFAEEVEESSCEEILLSRVERNLIITSLSPLIRSNLHLWLMEHYKNSVDNVWGRVVALGWYIFNTVLSSIKGVSDVNMEKYMDTCLYLARLGIEGYSDNTDVITTTAEACEYMETVLVLYGPNLYASTSYDILETLLAGYNIVTADAGRVLLRTTYCTNVCVFASDTIAIMCLMLACSFHDTTYNEKTTTFKHVRVAARIGQRQIEKAVLVYTSDIRSIWIKNNSLDTKTKASRRLFDGRYAILDLILEGTEILTTLLFT